VAPEATNNMAILLIHTCVAAGVATFYWGTVATHNVASFMAHTATLTVAHWSHWNVAIPVFP
jgi:hypothetical protein